MSLNKQRNHGTMRDMEIDASRNSGNYAKNLLTYLSQKLAQRLGIDDYFTVMDVLKKIDGRLSSTIIRDDAIFYTIMEMGELISTANTRANAISLLDILLKHSSETGDGMGLVVSFTSDKCILRLISYKGRIGIGAIYNGDMEVIGIETLQEPITCEGELIVVGFDESLVEDIIEY